VAATGLGQQGDRATAFVTQSGDFAQFSIGDASARGESPEPANPRAENVLGLPPPFRHRRRIGGTSYRIPMQVEYRTEDEKPNSD